MGTRRKLPLSLAAGITISEESRFNLSPAGRQAIIAPVRDRAGMLFDLAAWFLDDPGSWYLKEGEAVVLGASELAGAATLQHPIRLHTTPAEWVLAGGKGVAVLDWSVDLGGLFDGIPRILLDHLPKQSAATAERLLKRNFWQHLPQIGGRHGR